ncbi:F-type conjugal transfer pilus assembly protein TraB, partial [Enterobacter hormaechei subsp. steigerwaltii]
EPAPDMTGVVDSTFDQKVQQHATTEMQATASEMQKQYAEMRRELELLSKGQAGYQHQIDKLSQDNAALSAQV